MENLGKGMFILSADLGNYSFQHAALLEQPFQGTTACWDLQSQLTLPQEFLGCSPGSCYRLGGLPAVLADPSPYGKLAGITMSLAL